MLIDALTCKILAQQMKEQAQVMHDEAIQTIQDTIKMRQRAAQMLLELKRQNAEYK